MSLLKPLSLVYLLTSTCLLFYGCLSVVEPPPVLLFSPVAMLVQLIGLAGLYLYGEKWDNAKNSFQNNTEGLMLLLSLIGVAWNGFVLVLHAFQESAVAQNQDAFIECALGLNIPVFCVLMSDAQSHEEDRYQRTTGGGSYNAVRAYEVTSYALVHGGADEERPVA